MMNNKHDIRYYLVDGTGRFRINTVTSDNEAVLYAEKYIDRYEYKKEVRVVKETRETIWELNNE